MRVRRICEGEEDCEGWRVLLGGFVRGISDGRRI